LVTSALYTAFIYLIALISNWTVLLSVNCCWCCWCRPRRRRTGWTCDTWRTTYNARHWYGCFDAP